MSQKTTFYVELDDEAMETLLPAAAQGRVSGRHYLNQLVKVSLSLVRDGKLVLKPPARPAAKHLH